MSADGSEWARQEAHGGCHAARLPPSESTTVASAYGYPQVPSEWPAGGRRDAPGSGQFVQLIADPRPKEPVRGPWAATRAEDRPDLQAPQRSR